MVKPKGIVKTGWPAVAATSRQLGITFDPWQDGAGKLILAKRADGLYAADTIVISIPRQVGKTYLIGAIVFSLCIIFPGLTVIWTAHRFKTARDVFESLRGMASREQMKPHVKVIYTGAGDEQIQFHNGSKILFGARERGFGRGIPAVSVLVFDEAQILTSNAIDDMIPTTNTVENPLVFMIGTPPKPKDSSEVFTQLRREALSGESDDTLYIEFSANADADVDDKEAWAKANPSYPKRTSWRAILRMRKHMTADSVPREGLGIWDDDAQRGPFSAGCWKAGIATTDPPKPNALGLALDIERSWLSLAAGFGGEDATPFVGAVDRGRLDTDRDRILKRVAEIVKKRGIPVAIDAKGPAGTLVDDMLVLGVEESMILDAGLNDYIQACADLFDAVEARRFSHGDDPELNAAVSAAGWRKINDRRAWSRKSGDVSMLEAATLALWGAGQNTTYDVLDSFY